MYIHISLGQPPGNAHACLFLWDNHLEMHMHAELCSHQARQAVATPQLHRLLPLEAPPLAEHLETSCVSFQAPALAKMFRKIHCALPKLESSCSIDLLVVRTAISHKN
jgi:hypothetical protein